MILGFEAGDRVFYVGPIPYIRDQPGTVRGIARNAWVVVDFDDGEQNVKCAAVNLRRIN
jgi:hypothetical protein